jgi:beta-lactamase regulating signal transducer with metallopeptidase domain
VIAAILLGLIKANLAAGAAVLAVLALRRLVRPRFGARAAYALWLAPLAAAAAVLLPHPPVSASTSPVLLSAQAAAADVADAFVAQAPAAVGVSVEVPALIFVVWVAGALGMATLVLRRQRRFVAAMGQLTPSEDPGVFRAQSPHVGPAVVGAWRPRIVAPADFETRFAADERRLILAHEEAHLRTGDATVNALACALQCVSWFNPLVYLGVRTLRVDQELACDAAVIVRFPQARRIYAELLLKTQIATQPLPLGCHWPAGADHPLKERIAMLKSPLPAVSMRTLGLVVAGALSVGIGGLAWATQPGPGAPERAAAEADAALHPDYTCDPAGEARGEGCRIVRTSPWLALPTHGDVLQHYPAAALKAGVTAEVSISCAVTTSGHLRACDAVGAALHSQAGGGVNDDTRTAFDKAAVELSRYYQARLRPPLPKSWEGHGVFRVVFSPSPNDPLFAPPPQGARPMPPLPPPLRPAPVVERRPAGLPKAALTSVSFAPSDAAKAFAVGPSPNWSRRPTMEDLVQAYPAEAVKGDVLLHCLVALTGKLADCSVLSETPEGAGFGPAALKLTALFEAREQTPDGGPKRGGEIRIPIRFRLPTATAPSAN